MQFGKVISFKGFRLFFRSLKNNAILIIFALLFLIGFIIGTFSYKGSSAFVSLLNDKLDLFIGLRNESSIIKICFNSFLTNFTYLVLMFFFGTSVLGISVIPFISGFVGIYYGGFFSALYSVYSIKGLAYSIFFVLPFSVIFSVILTNCAKESIAFSLKSARLTFSRSMPYSLYYDFKNYCNKYIIFTIILILTAFFDALIAYYFGNYLSL